MGDRVEERKTSCLPKPTPSTPVDRILPQRSEPVRGLEEGEVFEIDKSTFDRFLADMVNVPVAVLTAVPLLKPTKTLLPAVVVTCPVPLRLKFPTGLSIAALVAPPVVPNLAPRPEWQGGWARHVNGAGTRGGPARYRRRKQR